MLKNKLPSTPCNDCASKSHSVFCRLHHDELEMLSDHKTTLHYKKGTPIFHEGSYPNGVYCIQQGKVKLTIQGDSYKEQIVRLCKAGDLLGYRALFAGDKLSATATTLDDSVICFIPKENFLNVIKMSSSFSLDMLSLMSRDIRIADENITHMAQKPVRERTAEAIVLLMDTFGFEADGKTIDVKLSREEIANIIGTAMETVVRFLTELRKDHIIDLKGKQIIVENKKELIRLANLYA